MSNFQLRFTRCAQTSFLLFIVAVLGPSFLTSCINAWGPLNNPVDPLGQAYQGYETIEDVNAAKPNSTDYGRLFFIPKLTASKVIGAEAYRFQISATADFAVSLFTSAEVASNVYFTKDWVGFSATIYYWRVQAKKGGTWGAWSPGCAFTLVSMDAGVVKPIDGGTTNDSTPDLDWADASGVDAFDLQLASTSDNLSNSAVLSSTASMYTVANALAEGKWYWRVRPKSSEGAVGVWTSNWSFTYTPLVIMVSVGAGSFNNGKALVNLSPFKISKYEITQSQYQTVMGMNPSYNSNHSNALNCPVENVTWYDAIEFCNKLSDREGLQSVYVISSRIPSTGYPIKSATVIVDFTKKGYRLPLEAQWEYAARGGPISKGYTYAGSNNASEVAWYDELFLDDSKPHLVGTKKSNELGLYDMSGNVWEWCWDWRADYSNEVLMDPTGSLYGSKRILRGGSYYNGDYSLGVSHRWDYSPAGTSSGFGIRVVVP